jgi:hypothetical protein
VVVEAKPIDWCGRNGRGYTWYSHPAALSSFNMLYLKIIRQVQFNPENIGEDYNG